MLNLTKCIGFGLNKKPGLSWKPLDVPLAQTLDIPDDDFKCVIIQGRNGIEPNIKEDQRPLKERVNGVR